MIVNGKHRHLNECCYNAVIEMYLDGYESGMWPNIDDSDRFYCKTCGDEFVIIDNEVYHIYSRNKTIQKRSGS